MISRRSVQIAIAGVLILLGVLGVVTRSTSLSASDLARNEFTQDYVSARAARDGVDPYQETFPLVYRYLGAEARSYETPLFPARNPHPPAQILLADSVSGLGYRTARLAWLAAMALCFALALGLAAKEMGLPPSWSAVTGVASLAIPIVQKDLLYGQVNGVLLLAAVGGWLALRRERYALAGILIGFAAAVKLFPVFLIVPMFRISKRAVGWLLATSVGVTLISAAILGWSSLHRFFIEASPSNFRFWRAAPVSVSLIGFPFRWLSPNVWNRDASNAQPVAWLFVLVIILVCIAGAYRTKAIRSGDLLWAATPWMILATPLAWESYLTLTIPFCFAIVAQARKHRRLPSPVLMIAVALILIGVPPGLPGSSRGIGLVAQLLGYALPTWALLTAAVADLRGRPERDNVDVSEAAQVARA